MTRAFFESVGSIVNLCLGMLFCSLLIAVLIGSLIGRVFDVVTAVKRHRAKAVEEERQAAARARFTREANEFAQQRLAEARARADKEKADADRMWAAVYSWPELGVDR